MPNPSRVIALIEDERQEMFVRRYLRRLGLEPHQMRLQRSPSGEGSAEQWVRTRFAKEVNAYRSRSARAETALIVVIDADIHTVHGRWAQLGQALTEGGTPPIHNGERIARLVPKRNVETWILCLSEQVVDEATDYKGTRGDWDQLIPKASETLFQWTRPNADLPGHCIDSLHRGVGELRRLTF
jgi:hypothetical protein